MIQSIASRSLPDEEILYQRRKITVTPSWLEIKSTSYACRYIQKLKLESISPPRIEAGIIFMLSLIMAVWVGLQISNDVQPVALYWALLVLCVLLLTASSFVAFVMTSKYQLEVVLANEPLPLRIRRKTRVDILELHEALALAMDWYRTESEPAPQRSNKSETST